MVILASSVSLHDIGNFQEFRADPNADICGIGHIDFHFYTPTVDFKFHHAAQFGELIYIADRQYFSHGRDLVQNLR